MYLLFVTTQFTDVIHRVFHVVVATGGLRLRAHGAAALDETREQINKVTVNCETYLHRGQQEGNAC